LLFRFLSAFIGFYLRFKLGFWDWDLGFREMQTLGGSLTRPYKYLFIIAIIAMNLIAVGNKTVAVGEKQTLNSVRQLPARNNALRA